MIPKAAIWYFNFKKSLNYIVAWAAVEYDSLSKLNRGIIQARAQIEKRSNKDESHNRN